MTTTPTVWMPNQQANATPDGAQYVAKVADIGAGRYVVIWTDEDGSVSPSPGLDIVGQIFDAEGNPIGNEFQINNAFHLDGEWNPQIVSRPGGGFVVVFEDDEGFGTTAIRVETYDMNGDRITDDTPLTIASHPDDQENYGIPSIAMRDDGSYLVTYYVSTGLGTYLAGRIVDENGLVSDRFRIDPDATDDTLYGNAAVLADGNYAVLYYKGDALWAAVLDENGDAVGPPKKITSNVDAPNSVGWVALAGGGLVATWTQDDGDGDGDGIMARLVDSSGWPVGVTITVNTTTAGDQRLPEAVALDDGGFVITWTDDSATFAQRYDAEGYRVGDEFKVSDGRSADAALLSDGRFVVATNARYQAVDPDIFATILDPRGKVIDGTDEADLLTSRKDGATVNGKGGSDTLAGQEGDDTLDGGTGSDVMAGRKGNDTYFVDHIYDRVIEAAGEGTDLVKASISYTLGSHVEKLTLTGGARDGTGNGLDNLIVGNGSANKLAGLAGNDRLVGGDGNDDLDGGTGNDILEGGAGNDSLDGGTGNDLLDGGSGNDTMVGGDGDDTYIVDSVGDKVVESAGGGTDTVRSSISYVLGDNVEKLVLTGSAKTQGTGGAEADTIVGSEGRNKLKGGAGGDFLSGGLGKDKLIGNGGKDNFVFDTELGRSNVDKIKGFKANKEKIWLDEDIFSAIGGKLSRKEFAVGKKASDKNDFIVFDEAKGRVYYDEDGKGGAKQMLFAKVGSDTDLDHKDFRMIDDFVI